MLHRIWPLLKEVYHYEKHSTLDSDYLRQVLTLAVVVLFALNFSCNGLDKPVVFVLTGLTSLVLLMVEWLLPRAKNEKHLVMFSNTALIFIGLLLLVWNENDGFQNLWFFLMPATLFVQSGLPIGLPFCTAYGLAATCFLWLGPLVGSTLYRRDYALFYPAAYWSFCLLMITADIFYKHYRIQQEQSEKEMEREVHATICEARQLMVSSVAAISQMIDEKDRYTSEHSHRVAEYARLIGAHMGFAGEELDSLYRSALLHDIGKIAVPDAILNKPSRLTDEEFDIMKQHTVWGRKKNSRGAGISASGRLRCQLPPRAVRRQRLPRRAERRAAAGDGLDHQRRRCAGRHGLRPVLPRPLRQGLHHRRVPEIERDAVRACGGQGRGGAAGKRRDSGAVTRQKDVL